MEDYVIAICIGQLIFTNVELSELSLLPCHLTLLDEEIVVS